MQKIGSSGIQKMVAIGVFKKFIGVTMVSY